MKIFCSLFCCASLLLPLGAVAGSRDSTNEFNVGELRKIRGVSQAILKVRGQKRRNVVAETQDIRDDVVLMKSMILESEQFAVLNNLKAVDGLASTPDLVQESRPTEKLSFWQRIRRSLHGKTKVERQNVSPMVTRDNRLNDRLDKIIKIAAERKLKAEANGPSILTFWEEPTAKDARIIRAMEKINATLESIKNTDGEEKRIMLRGLVSRMKAKQEVAPVEPTLVSITKHIRK